MSVESIVAVAVGILTIIGGIVAFHSWLIGRARRDFQMDALSARVEAIEKTHHMETQALMATIESLRDQINKLTLKIERLTVKMDDQA